MGIIIQPIKIRQIRLRIKIQIKRRM